jgi:sec-independent protein translocase protein TatB
MNIFSNIGITELIVILLLALIVVGPERLPEIGQKLGRTLRDVRRAYDKLARDLGPELTSIQKTTQELRESVESVRSIPQDMVKTVVKAADLDDTIEELKGVADSVSQTGKTLSGAGKMVRDPVGSAVRSARSTLLHPPPKPGKQDDTSDSKPEGQNGMSDSKPEGHDGTPDSKPEEQAGE